MYQWEEFRNEHIIITEIIMQEYIKISSFKMNYRTLENW